MTNPEPQVANNESRATNHEWRITNMFPIDSRVLACIFRVPQGKALSDSGFIQ